ncbi:hypothetical protein QUF70_05950 [Desulfobacterales bacterium HSG17]|nr:hypothetical protein [Desulfobacterales bacterium HSG17]
MGKEDIKKLLKPVIWDYYTDPYEVFETASGKKDRAGCFTRETALIRMLERLSWYDLINLFGIDKLTKLLTPKIISGIRIQELREKYEFARKILQGEPVSFSGWDPEYRKKIRHTLLSNRWYSNQQRIL